MSERNEGGVRVERKVRPHSRLWWMLRPDSEWRVGFTINRWTFSTGFTFYDCDIFYFNCGPFWLQVDFSMPETA